MQKYHFEDWCMKVSGARRRRTSKADQLQKRYSKDENFLVAIEDFQIDEDEKGKAEAEENVKNYFLRYCMEYMALYFGNDELNLNNIKWNNLNWIEGWSGRLDWRGTCSVKKCSLGRFLVTVHSLAGRERNNASRCTEMLLLQHFAPQTSGFPHKTCGNHLEFSGDLNCNDF